MSLSRHDALSDFTQGYSSLTSQLGEARDLYYDDQEPPTMPTSGQGLFVTPGPESGSARMKSTPASLRANTQRNRVSKPPRPSPAAPSSSRRRHVQEEETPTPLHDRLTEMTTILVYNGRSSAKKFTGHSGQLSAESPTLRNLIHPPGSNDNPKPEVKYTADPAHFSVWLGWAYFKKVENQDLEGTPFSPFGKLLGLYLLGWKLKSPAFMNEIVSAICAKSQTSTFVFHADEINRIFAETPESLPLRNLAVAQWVAGLSQKELNWEDDRNCDKEFLYQCFKLSLGGKAKSPDTRPEDFWVKEPLPTYSSVKTTVMESGVILIDDDD